MKKQIIIRLLLVILLSYVVAYPETTIINKLKVTGNTYTSTNVILGFVREFKEGDTVDVHALNNLAAAIKRRLLMTTWFYSVDVYVVKRELNEKTSNVIIEVQEGYLYRFGGGNAFGSFGKQNISGKGFFAGVDAGYNKQAVCISRLYSRYYYMASGGNKPFTYTDSGHQGKDVQIVGGTCETGINLPYDIRIGLRFDACKLFSDTYRRIDGFVGESFLFKRDTRDDFFSPANGSYIACRAGYLSGPELSSASLDARLYYSLIGQNIKWAVQAKIAGIRGTIRDYFYYPSLYGIDGIRAPSAAGMNGNVAVQIVTELRTRIFKKTAFGFVSIAAEPALFFAVGCAGNSANHFLNNDHYKYAYGVAGRLFLYEPVFLSLRLECGWNESGANAVFFSVTEPF